LVKRILEATVDGSEDVADEGSHDGESSNNDYGNEDEDEGIFDHALAFFFEREQHDVFPFYFWWKNEEVGLTKNDAEKSGLEAAVDGSEDVADEGSHDGEGGDNDYGNEDEDESILNHTLAFFFERE
jgi:hypothetical protein